ncbi:MAG TPA: AraC family transcriptional regulator [Gemmatimonadaceae bacterium]|jgi:AraC-like DNA-binding protein|nr:AraC family transcriptional regulator [Gemmatimonadaceae bacterium]
MPEQLRERMPSFTANAVNAQESHVSSLGPLSDVLRAVRLNGAHFYYVEAGHPWSVNTVPAVQLVPRILPNAEHLISYHIIVSGSCWGGPYGAQVQLNAGDVILLAHGDAHLMSSAKDYVDRSGANGTQASRFFSTVQLGPADQPRDTRLVCGFLGCDARPFNPLLGALPPVIVIPGAAGGFLSQFPKQVVAETRAGRVGSETMLTRMAELMFIEVLRRYVETLPPQQAGWLGALRDAVVGPALSKLHEEPTRSWTLAELAKEIASSRTVLVERFSQLVGVPPMLYLTRWRLQLAAEQLARGSAKVAAIGAQVGYESEAAFSRAFKRETGFSPAAWRRARE